MLPRAGNTCLVHTRPLLLLIRGSSTGRGVLVEHQTGSVADWAKKHGWPSHAQQVSYGDPLASWSRVQVSAELAGRLAVTPEATAGLNGGGSHPLRVWQASAERSAELLDGVPAEGYVLRLSNQHDQAGVEVAATDLRGLRYADATLAQLLRGACPSRELELRDWPAIARRGFMECFYGPTWTPADREWLISLAASYRLNTFCYGPADDPYTGTLWAEPYPATEQASLAELVAHSAAEGVDVVWRVSPCAPLDPEAGIVFSEPSQIDRLVAKCQQLLDLGVHTVLVAFDDIDGALMHDQDRRRFGSGEQGLARAHAELINQVASALAAHDPDAAVVLCPTQYWGSTESTYRSWLGRLVDPAIETCWTGPAVVSHQVSATDAGRVREQLAGRRLWLWDNFPVNDWGGTPLQSQGRVQPDILLLGPLERRDPDAAATLGTYAINGGIQSAATALALPAAGHWAWNPSRYDCETSWQHAVDVLGDRHGDLHLIAQLHRPSPLHASLDADLAVLLWQYLLDLDGGRNAQPSADALERSLHAAATAGRRLQTSDVRASESLVPWLQTLVIEADAGILALQIVESVRRGKLTAVAEIGAAFRDRLAELGRTHPPTVAAGILGPLLERARLCAGLSIINRTASNADTRDHHAQA